MADGTRRSRNENPLRYVSSFSRPLLPLFAAPEYPARKYTRHKNYEIEKALLDKIKFHLIPSSFATLYESY